MFQLDHAIAEWRREVSAGGLRSREVLDELESHLQDEIGHHVQMGASEREAFQSAVRQLGYVDVLAREFSKIGETNDFLVRIRNVLLTLAGIPNLTLVANMNTPTPTQNVEPAWAPYLKYGAFAMPATTLWLFVAVFVFPKFNQIVIQSGIHVPGVFRFGMDLLLLLKHYLFLMGSGFVLALVLLELRFDKWPRYRRTAFGVGAFLLNSAVLLSITSMVVLALIALSELMHHAK
jgi:hypothetical protein